MSDQTASDTVHLSAGSGHGPGLSPAGQVQADSGPIRSDLAGPDSPQDVATTVGAKRSAFGQGGRALTVLTNHFDVEIPKQEIYHYNVISPSEKPLPASVNVEIIERLQTTVAPELFTHRVVYDGQKSIFSPRQLSLLSKSQEFTVTFDDPVTSGEGHDNAVNSARVYTVKLTHVATINPEVLARFLQAKQASDNSVLTAITALNVVIRMEPTVKFPCKDRSIFTSLGMADIGGGIVLWRGYFESTRPTIGRMLINVDVSTAAMYKPGRVIDIALELLGMTQRGPLVLSTKHGFPDRELIKLQRFLSGVRINVDIPGQPMAGRRPLRIIKKLTSAGASEVSFTTRDGETTTVAQYFEKTHNYRLQFPDIVCVEIGGGAIIPMECCTIPEGQIMRKQMPPQKSKDLLAFAMKKPRERLESIRAAVGELEYGQSDCMRQFGMHVSPNADVLSLKARVLDPPTLMYGLQGDQPTVTPRNGAWNMVDKKCYQPVTIDRWVVVVYERKERFSEDAARDMVKKLLQQFAALGIVCNEEDPVVVWERPTDITATLQDASMKVIEKHSNEGLGPDLMVVVLPESSPDMYRSVKHFGDIKRGVATQCLRTSKCIRGNKQYFVNVCLKINAKLGGINAVAKPRDIPALDSEPIDLPKPTIVMGVHNIGPAPGDDHQAQSFAALVGNVDSDTVKYVADCRAKPSRRDVVDDLEAMATSHIALYKSYQKAVEKKSPDLGPQRVVVYRSGVSAGQFKNVLKLEVPQLKRALAASNLDTKLTVVVVAKAHHVRFFPKDSQDADKSGNCPAGTVGTSLPTHYHVLYDENEFTPDALQSFSFDLCHVYAGCTRSVSMPAPAYYARLACARARNHYNSDAEGTGKSELGRPLTDQITKRAMYFC